MNIKEIVLNVADSLRNKIDGISHMQSNQGLARFAEALIAEIAKQNEPVAWWNGKETAFFEHETDGPVGEVKIPLYTVPPTAEQIANETAEACAAYCEAYDLANTTRSGTFCAQSIRRGTWKEFK